ncbi:MAG: Zn-ribbon domain-containing OB-fold protein [Lautropia sp.]
MTFVRPQITAVSAPYWDGLKQGRLQYQHCSRCGANWLPPRTHCTACLAPEPQWHTASGRARLISWVVYHTAYHESFAGRIPYNVACVELEEGPRLLSNVVTGDMARDLVIDAPLVLKIEHEDDIALARFEPARA